MKPLLFFQLIINGVFLGALYSLIGVGLTLVYGTMKLINVAHCEFMMLSMYITYWLWALLGIDPLLSLFICIPLFFVLGWLVQKLVIKPVMLRPIRSQMIMTFGLLLVIQHLVLAYWTPDFRLVKAPYSDLTFRAGDFFIYFPHLLAFSVALPSCLLLYTFLKRTYMGVSIRATAQDIDTAEILGIDTLKVHAITFGLGTACTAIAGTLLSIFFPFDPYVGGTFMVTAFVVVVLGGLGNFLGTFISGLIIGLVLSFFGFWTPQLKNVIMLLVFLLVLTFRPEGIFGRQRRR